MEHVCSMAREHLEGEPLGQEARRVPLSQLLWDIDWRRRLPVKLTDDDILVKASSFEAASVFVAEHYAELFEEEADSPFSTRAASPAKTRYYQLAGDFFEFCQQGRTIGLLVCDPLDWSTYYIRSTAVLRDFQGRQLVAAFCKSVLFEELARAGVERIECHTSPANLAMMHIMSRLRFNTTGTELSERWGALVRFTKFLDARSEQTFLRQFCAGIKYQLRKEPT